MTGPKELIDKLHKNQELSLEEWTELIKNRTPELSEYLFELAREERHKYYGHDVYVRGLIEFYKLLSKRLPLLWYSKK